MSPLDQEPARAEQVSEVLAALAHPLRIRIVSSLLRQGECNVGALAEQLGAAQSVVSQHLRILRMRYLVEAARRDGFAWYRVAEPRLAELLRCLESCKLH